MECLIPEGTCSSKLSKETSIKMLTHQLRGKYLKSFVNAASSYAITVSYIINYTLIYTRRIVIVCNIYFKAQLMYMINYIVTVDKPI